MDGAAQDRHFEDCECLTDICRCESEFNVNAKLVNGPGSIDRGLFQSNSHFHPQITDTIAYDPFKATKHACDAIKQEKAMAYWKASSLCWDKGGVYNSIL